MKKELSGRQMVADAERICSELNKAHTEYVERTRKGLEPIFAEMIAKIPEYVGDKDQCNA